MMSKDKVLEVLKRHREIFAIHRRQYRRVLEREAAHICAGIEMLLRDLEEALKDEA